MAKRRTPRPVAPQDFPARYTCFFDGCCEPVNPGGTAGFGAVAFDSALPGGRYGERVWECSRMIPPAPSTSNNVAEYLAINAIFDWLLERDAVSQTIHVFGDSRLVICQLWGHPLGVGKKWKVHGVDTTDKKPGFYAPHAVQARGKLALLPRCYGFWIPRDENDIADELSKAELKRAGVEFRIQPEE